MEFACEQYRRSQHPKQRYREYDGVATCQPLLVINLKTAKALGLNVPQHAKSRHAAIHSITSSARPISAQTVVGLLFSGWQPWLSTMSTNVAIAAVVAVLIWFIGVWPFLLVQLPIVLLAGSVGVWLFYVQHQFERTFWAHEEQMRRLRLNDGVFFTKAGAIKLARYVERELSRVMSNRVPVALPSGPFEATPFQSQPSGR